MAVCVWMLLLFSFLNVRWRHGLWQDCCGGGIAELGAIFELLETRWPQGLFIPPSLVYSTHTHTYPKKTSVCVLVYTLFMVYMVKNVPISLPLLLAHLHVAVRCACCALMNRFRVNRCCLQNAVTFSDLGGIAFVQTEGFCVVFCTAVWYSNFILFL